MSGRLIIDGPMDPAENMAVDEALARACDGGSDGFPALRLYWWCVPTMSIGAKERLEEAADVKACRDLGIALVRRPTGGRAVLHDHELTYAVIGPLGAKPFDGNIEESYRLTAEALREGISRIGIDLTLTAGGIKMHPRTLPSRDAPQHPSLAASMRHLPCFVAPSRYELTWQGRKVVGSAQRRLRNSVLQHGSILFTTDAETLARASGSDPQRIDELAAAMIGIEEIAGRSIERKELFEPLADAFGKVCGTTFHVGELTPEERTLADGLVSSVKAKIDANLPD